MRTITIPIDISILMGLAAGRYKDTTYEDFEVRIVVTSDKEHADWHLKQTAAKEAHDTYRRTRVLQGG